MKLIKAIQSIGKNGQNNSLDIKQIQALINVYHRSIHTKTRLLIDGKWSDALQFELNWLYKKLHPDKPLPAGYYTLKMNDPVFHYLENILRQKFKSTKSIFLPEQGRLTFEAQGHEGGPYHSRCLHIPSPASGLTMGRGYDMKYRSAPVIVNDLTRAGVPGDVVRRLAKASGLIGEKARQFVIEQDLLDFELSPRAQLLLFNLVYKEYVDRAKDICMSVRTVKDYGPCDWQNLNPKIKEVVIDMTYIEGITITPIDNFCNLP